MVVHAHLNRLIAERFHKGITPCRRQVVYLYKMVYCLANSDVHASFCVGDANAFKVLMKRNFRLCNFYRL